MIVTTEEMVRWLRGLPPDQRFCTDDHCPIMEYLWREHMTLLTAMDAWKANRFVAEAADTLHKSSLYGWSRITPRKLLCAMSSPWLRSDLKHLLKRDAKIPRLPAPRGEKTCITQS